MVLRVGTENAPGIGGGDAFQGARAARGPVFDPGPAPPQARQPILDMHLHACKVDYIGPDPPLMCAPFAMMPRWDSSKPGMDGFTFSAMPPCAEPFLPAITDEQVMDGTSRTFRVGRAWWPSQGRTL